VEKIQRLINQLLLFRQIESNNIKINYQAGDLIKFVNDIVDLFQPYAKIKNINLNITSFENSIIVQLERDILEKILFNLISNALKYSPEGEFVSLRIYLPNQEDVVKFNTLTSSKTDRTTYVSIEITNTGVEISPENQKAIFSPFTKLTDNISQNPESTGLGLSIVNELVDILKGEIALTSKANEVTFKITLPFVYTVG